MRAFTEIRSGGLKGEGLSKAAIAITGAEWEQQVIDLAHLFGWRAAHFRSVRIQRRDGSYYYATPVQADGEGFPDMILVHLEQKRTIFAECKAGSGRLTPQQVAWKVLLEAGQAEYYLWRPDDFEEIKRILEGRNG